MVSIALVDSRVQLVAVIIQEITGRDPRDIQMVNKEDVMALLGSVVQKGTKDDVAEMKPRLTVAVPLTTIASSELGQTSHEHNSIMLPSLQPSRPKVFIQ